MATRERFMEILGIPNKARSDKYLGLPVYIGCSKGKMFEYFKDQVWKRIQGWEERLLPEAGKEILIKVTMPAIPTYAMSCFNLTKLLCVAERTRGEGGWGTGICTCLTLLCWQGKLGEL